ncbi:MAG: aldehyde dehydrogenase family protein [Candidatus Sumerlaeia bacterium]|nr:aldehyde dehydrogenase family protein [Candidatus Sumerlaeia bacterium]
MYSREEIEAVVAEVLGRMNGHAAPKPPPAPAAGGRMPGVFETMDQAVEAAEKAFFEFRGHTMEQRERYVAVLRRVGLEMKEPWSRAEEAETKLGRWSHKVLKFDAVCKYTPGTEDLPTWAKTGDHGLTIEEYAPYGVVAAVTPSTHPCATLICNGIGFLAAGNAGVFNAHPASKRVFAEAVAHLNRELVAAGAPENLLTTIAEPTVESAEAMFRHPKTRLILVTGGPAVVNAALAVPKKAITAGPGNPPVVVDATADLATAARHLVAGAGFDNNVLCIGEKEVFCVDRVFDAFKRELLAQGCVELDRPSIDRLATAAFPRHDGKVGLNRNLVGRNASVLAEAAGLRGLGSEVPLLIGEVDAAHDFVQEEQLMPFLPLVRVRDVDEAIARSLDAEHGYRHTAVMHSRDVAALSRMARACDCSIFVKNGPCFAGLGYGGEGYCSFSIASPTGEGLTSARTFARKRRCTLVDSFRIV